MSEQKKQVSKLCLTGFILAIVSPILWICNLFLSRVSAIAYGISLVLPLLMPLVGLILSIVGVATAGKSGKSGKGLGIAGIVLPIVYAVFVVVAVGLFGALLAISIKSDIEEQKQNELYDMDGVHLYKNTEYDVSSYRLLQGYDVDMNVSEADLQAFADSRLEEISRESDERIRGTYQGYEFIIIRSDYFDEWLSDCTGSLCYSEDGYATIEYEADWEFATFRNHTLDVYKDPSDQFIIITNCDDDKVTSEFFG